MLSLRLQNYRSFADTGTINLRPLNFLLGANGTGKSSLVKFFPLLKQSMRRHTNGIFLWYDTDVDFKDFQNTVKEGTEEMTVTMTLPLPFRIPGRVEHEVTDFIITMMIASKPIHHHNNREDEETEDFLKSLTLEFKGNRVDIAFENSYLDTKIRELIINGTNLTPLISDAWVIISNFMPGFLFHNTNSSLSSIPEQATHWLERIMSLPDGSVAAEAQRLIWNFIPMTPDELKARTMEWLGMGEDQVKAELQEYEEPEEGAEDTDGNIILTPDVAYILQHLNNILDTINNYLKSQATKIKYIQPLRAQAKRYYRYQNVSLEEIDSHGDNLAMYLYNLRGRLDKLNVWLEKNFDFTIDVKSIGGHIELRIKEKGARNSINLVDTGFGYSQLLPIIVQIWSAIHDRDRLRNVMARRLPFIVAIEQPELHLHPHMIGKFARMLGRVIGYAKSFKLNLIFLIETHSKTLIETIGEMIYIGNLTDYQDRPSIPELTSEDVQVLIFNPKEDERTTEITVSEYDADGYLTNWPIGFFEPDAD